MYSKMLVLLDGSKLAEVVFTYAQELSARLNIDLELLHVCIPQEAEQLPMRQVYIEHMAEVLRKKAAEIRLAIGDKTTSPQIKARGEVVVGYPAEEILKYADKNNIDLIMLSTHGQSGVKAWDIGNVANKVIHASKIPLWIVPTELKEEIIYDKLPKRPMVIPLDCSKLSEKVIPHAINIAKQRGAESEIVLIHVEEIIRTLSASHLKRQEAESLKKKKHLDNIVKRIGKEGIKARAELLIGDPAKAIVSFIEDNPTQLVVLATHGRVGLSRMIFGSTTENILHLVKKVPIFVIKSMELM
jgi:nucleotide-binding universal stress UspA family protein